MQFLILPVNDEIKEIYSNHSTYHEGDSGLDLFIIEDDIIKAGETKLVDLGVKCQLVDNYNRYFSYNMYARSSISKTPLRLANGVGLCDAAYMGNLKAALHNTSTMDYQLKKGERYVQLARSDLGEISFKIVSKFERKTSRGEGGFGSTNIKQD